MLTAINTRPGLLSLFESIASRLGLKCGWRSWLLGGLHSLFGLMNKPNLSVKRPRPGMDGDGELMGQLANPGSPGKMAVKMVCVCVCVVTTSSRWRRCFMAEHAKKKKLSSATLSKFFTHTHTRASVTKQYNLVPANGRWCSAAGEVTAGLAESNGSLPPGLCIRSGSSISSGPHSPLLSFRVRGTPLPFYHVVLFTLCIGLCVYLPSLLWHLVGRQERYPACKKTRSSADADNGLDAFVGQSRSRNILNPFQVK